VRSAARRNRAVTALTCQRCARVRVSDALCGNLLAAHPLAGPRTTAPSALVFHAAGRAGTAVAAHLVCRGFSEEDVLGVCVAHHERAAPLPLRQLALAPGAAAAACRAHIMLAACAC
jgi:hypothetical protein